MIHTPVAKNSLLPWKSFCLCSTVLAMHPRAATGVGGARVDRAPAESLRHQRSSSQRVDADGDGRNRHGIAPNKRTGKFGYISYSLGCRLL